METIDKYFNGLGNYFSKNSTDFLNLIPKCNQFSVEEIKVIYKALYKAMELHSGQVRKTGDPYINHPIGAASILASYGLDYEVVSAALLHDTIEDTSYTLDDCEKDFGKNIARLVDGATKIGRDVNHYTHKKILDNIKFDARFIAVKAGDRLHNLYTLEALSKNKQKEIALETKCFYVPIAKILGIYKLKDEFQDLSLYYLNKDEFLKYYELRNSLKEECSAILQELCDMTQSILSKSGIAMTYNYRVKNVGGIHDEMINYNDIDNICDLFAIKMVLKDELQCYSAYHAVKYICQNSSSIANYIKNPKSNGYRSLNFNTTYKDLDMQVRIRTEDMQKKNDLGVFSNWNENTQYKINTDMKKNLEGFAKKMNL